VHESIDYRFRKIRDVAHITVHSVTLKHGNDLVIRFSTVE
jgi:hypothetical protein